GAAAEVDDGPVRTVAAMLGIGDVADRFAAELDAIAGGAVGMVEGRRPHGKGAAGKRLSALEFPELDLRPEDLERHRIERRLHELAHDLLKSIGRLEVASP